MEEGQEIKIEVDGEEKFGKVVKVYTQIGYESHGKEMVVILLHDSHLRFYEGEITLMNQ